MGKLNVSPNIAFHDDVYETLVNLTAGLDDAAGLKAQARLILLLANHIGDADVIADAAAIAAMGGTPPASS